MIDSLTREERIRFAAWLEQEAATDSALAEQLEKLGPAMAPAVCHRRAEADAAASIARKLRSIEEVGLGGNDRPR